MIDYDDMGEPVIITRDPGHRKSELLSPENRKRVKERVENPDIVTGNYKLKDLFSEIGIVVNPEKMTNWYVFQLPQPDRGRGL